MSPPCAAALEVGHRLAAEALWYDGSCTWLGAEDSPSTAGRRRSGPTRSRLLGSTLYSGTPGIAIVLAAMGRLDGDPAFARTARGAVRQAIRGIARQPAVGRVGLHEGISGLLYASSTCAELLHDDYFAEVAAGLLGSYGPPRDSDEHDVVAGAAGAIIALVTAYETSQLRGALEVAVRYGDLLLNTARARYRLELSAPRPSGQRSRPYGFAHGAAGELFALACLARASGEARFLGGSATLQDMLLDGFDPARGRWPDARAPHRETGSGHFSDIFWCRGSTGIAVALRAGQDPAEALGTRVLSDVAAAMPDLAEDPTVNLGLCHGLAGCVEVLIDESSDGGLQIATRVLEGRLHQELCDALVISELSVRPLGLMTGMAGIALACLRAEAPELPSPLTLRVQHSPASTDRKRPNGRPSAYLAPGC